ncbi:hypothetical protein ACFLRF_00425 [Candidatus Altiarchaeota archaeon]
MRSFVLLLSMLFLSGCITSEDKIDYVPKGEPDPLSVSTTLSILEIESRWNRELVDHFGEISGHPCVMLDKDGLPSLFYFEALDNYVKFARRDDEEWSYDSIKSASTTEPLKSCHIREDSNRNNHIIFLTQNSNQLYYATYSDGWLVKNTDLSDGKIRKVRLEMGEWDDPEIALVAGDKVIHAVHYNDVWHHEIISGAGLDVDMDIDDDRQTHLAYLSGDFSTQQLHYVKKVLTNWKHELLLDDVKGIKELNLRVDDSFRPNIVYFDSLDDKLVYMYPEDGRWLRQVITGDVGEIGAIDFVIGFDGTSHVLYKVLDIEHPYIVYSVLVGGNWTSERITGSGDPSMAVDADGEVGIVYAGPINEIPEMYEELVFKPEENRTVLHYLTTRKKYKFI